MSLNKRSTDATPVLLVNLSPGDYEQFMGARLSYSAGTGPGARPENYHGLAPYIATYWDCLREAVEAMRWTTFTLSRRSDQWVVRRVDYADHNVRDGLSTRSVDPVGFHNEANYVNELHSKQRIVELEAELAKVREELALARRGSPFIVNESAVERIEEEDL